MYKLIILILIIFFYIRYIHGKDVKEVAHSVEQKCTKFCDAVKAKEELKEPKEKRFF